MRITRMLKVGAAVAALSLALTACGGSSGSTSSSGLVDKAKNDKKLVIGIKFDQPGLGLKTPDGKFTGFDVDVAKYVAKELGVNEAGITFKEAVSAERENLIQKGEVDFIAATYSITDARKEKVSFGGPYFVAHQDLLVKATNTDITGPETLNGKKLCSVKGSTSAQKVKDTKAAGVQLQEFAKYSDCITAMLAGSIDAVTTDDVILAGYAVQYPAGQLKLVGKGFTDEKYGIGLKKDDKAAVDAVNAAIKKMIADGSWKKALEANVGPSGYKVPVPPAVG